MILALFCLPAMSKLELIFPLDYDFQQKNGSALSFSCVNSYHLVAKRDY